MGKGFWMSTMEGNKLVIIVWSNYLIRLNPFSLPSTCGTPFILPIVVIKIVLTLSLPDSIIQLVFHQIPMGIGVEPGYTRIDISVNELFLHTLSLHHILFRQCFRFENVLFEFRADSN